MNSVCRLGIGLVGLLCLFSAPSHAHKRDFVWTYEWFTPTKGEKEIELWATHQFGADQLTTQAEFEYGVTDRWSIAPYVIFEKERGESLETKGWKLEQRYRFGNFKERHLLPAGYLELKKEEGAPYELETKAIFSHLDGNKNFALNLIAEKKLAGGEDIEVGYAAGVSKPIGGRTRGTIEAFGNFHDPKHAVGPGVAIDLAPNQRLNLNAAFGLNDRTDDLMLRLLYEYEWLPKSK
ncbi:MAG: transporter [Armatimonadetes bacterium]|nr:transporter [Armatimonadota bacterium]